MGEDQIEDSSDSASFTSGENDIFAIKDTLIPVREQKAAGTAAIDFDGLLDPPLRLKEDLKEGCGGQLWPAGMVLSRYMLRHHRHDLNGKTILELGAGGGLVGLAVAIGCNITAPPKLLITDQIPMYALMKENIELNDLGSKVEAAVYDWGGPVPEDISFETPGDATAAQTTQKPDIILAADCVYFEPTFPLLKDTLMDLIDDNPNPDAVCYFCFKKRRKADWRCIKMIEKVLNMEEITEDEGRDKEGYTREAIYLYKITKKKR